MSSTPDTRDKGYILNGIVDYAARIMEMKMENDLWIAQMQEQNQFNLHVAARLREKAERVQQAIEVMREFEGCWS